MILRTVFIISSVILIVLIVMPLSRYTKPVFAICTGHNLKADKKGRERHFPTFEYEYKGKVYRGQSLSPVKIADLRSYESGEAHQIYISRWHPEKFVVRKTIGMREILTMVFSLVTLVVGVLMFYFG